VSGGADGSWLERETAEQPEVAARFLDRTLPEVDLLREVLGAGRVDGVMLAARGSSDNAARYAQYLWQLRLGLPVALGTPSLHTVYGARLGLGRHAVVAVSQSGVSPDVVTVLEQARASGNPTLAVTNDPSSPLASLADHVLDLGAGQERSVAATKTYTASLLAVAVLAVALGDPSRRAAGERELLAVPAALEAALAETSGVEEAASVFAGRARAVTVGRGLNLSTAFETGLKLTELTGVLVAPYSVADLMHGPVAAVGPDVPVVAVAPEEPASASVLEAVPELRRRGAPVVVVGGPGGAEGGSAPGVATVQLRLPASAAVADWLTPLPAVVPGQLLARYVAEQRGVDVDHPGDLSKVTRTR
jgi:glucosamine--fructose-6-phosphate aminotransferase (isomerizing)